MAGDQLYRPNVGIMLVNPDGLVWVGKRLDAPDVANAAWQMPQGGVDKGEEPQAAAFRELREETGASQKHVTLLAQTTDWLRYDFPEHVRAKVGKGKYKGQKQLWYLMRFDGTEDDFDLDYHHREFSEWKWTDVDDLVPHIVPFKRDVYVEVVRQFREHLA